MERGAAHATQVINEGLEYRPEPVGALAPDGAARATVALVEDAAVVERLAAGGQ